MTVHRRKGNTNEGKGTYFKDQDVKIGPLLVRGGEVTIVVNGYTLTFTEAVALRNFISTWSHEARRAIHTD